MHEKKDVTRRFLIILFACAQQNNYEDGPTREGAISTFDILKGFSTEIFSAEPHHPF